MKESNVYLKEFEPPAFQQKNLSYYKTKIISTNVFKVSDKDFVFLLYASNNSFYHTIVEELGQALYLRKIIPNLRLILCYESTKNFSSVASELLKMFPFLEVMQRPIDEYDAVLIPNLVYCHYQNNLFLIKALGRDSNSRWSHFAIHKFFTFELRKAFSRFTEKSDISNNKKIYIKFDHNKGYQHGRKYSCQNVSMLENFFIKNNFEIVDPMSLSLLEQIEKISSASVVASLSGSSSTQCLWMKKNATFILMNLASPYYFPHDDLIKNNCQLIFLTDPASAVANSLIQLPQFKTRVI